MKMGHGKTVCKLCDKVVRQCKCFEGHKNVTETICDSCTKIVDKSTGIKMHHKFKNGIAFYDIPSSVSKLICQAENADDVMDELFEWLDDKFWICHEHGTAEEKKRVKTKLEKFLENPDPAEAYEELLEIYDTVKDQE